MNGIKPNCKEYCRDKGPKSYIGPWALSEDIDRSKEEQIAIKSSQLKSHK